MHHSLSSDRRRYISFVAVRGMQGLPAGGSARRCEVFNTPDPTEGTFVTSVFARLTGPQINNFFHVFAPARPSFNGILQDFDLLVGAWFWKAVCPTRPALEIRGLLPSRPRAPRLDCVGSREIWTRETGRFTDGVGLFACRWTCHRSLNSSAHQVCIFSSQQAHTVPYPICEVFTTE